MKQPIDENLKIGALLAYITVFLNILISLVLSPYTVKCLGQSEYGLLQLIWSFAGYVGLLDFGLGNTITRYVADYRAKADRHGEENFLALSAIIYLFISALMLIIGMALYGFIDEIFSSSLHPAEIDLAKKLFLVLLINFVLSIGLNIFPAVISGYEHFTFQRGIMLIRLIIRTVLLVFILMSGHRSVALAVLDTALTAFFMLVQAIYVFFVLKVKFVLHKFQRAFLFEIITFSFFIFLVMVFDQINWKLGQFVIGILIDSANVAVYSIAIQFPVYYMTFSSAISGVLLPRATQLANGGSGELLTGFLIRTGRIQWIILGAMLGGFTFFGRQFISLWIGSEFSQSYPIALIIMLALTLPLIQSAGNSILQAKNRHAFRAITYIATAPISILLTTVSVKAFGIIGAALGIAASFVVGSTVIMNIYYHFKIGLNIPEFFSGLCKGLLPASIATCFAGFAINLIPGESWMNFILKCALFLALYVVIFGIWGINDEEKSLFFSPFKKILKIG